MHPEPGSPPIPQIPLHSPICPRAKPASFDACSLLFFFCCQLIEGLPPYSRGFNRKFQKAYRQGLIFDTPGAIPKPNVVPDTLAPAGGGGWDIGVDGLIKLRRSRRREQSVGKSGASYPKPRLTPGRLPEPRLEPTTTVDPPPPSKGNPAARPEAVVTESGPAEGEGEQLNVGVPTRKMAIEEVGEGAKSDDRKAFGASRTADGMAIAVARGCKSTRGLRGSDEEEKVDALSSGMRLETGESAALGGIRVGSDGKGGDARSAPRDFSVEDG